MNVGDRIEPSAAARAITLTMPGAEPMPQIAISPGTREITCRAQLTAGHVEQPAEIAVVSAVSSATSMSGRLRE